MSKTVLITGASTGIGLDAVRIMIENHFRVVATVRKKSDQENLQNLFQDQVIPILMDVNDYDQVDALPSVLKQNHGITRLDGLVNNAGVALAGPFLDQDFSEMELTIKTNVLSLMKITKTLIPLLAADPSATDFHGGRIINISSVSGVSSLPFLSVYCASKHAVEGLSNALRNELKLLKIKVVVIGPGTIKTPIWQKGFESVSQRYAESVFAYPFERFMKLVQKEIVHALPVEAVSLCVLDAMTAENPKARYTPIPRKFRNVYLQKLLPQSWVDQTIAGVLKLNP